MINLKNLNLKESPESMLIRYLELEKTIKQYAKKYKEFDELKKEIKKLDAGLYGIVNLTFTKIKVKGFFVKPRTDQRIHAHKVESIQGKDFQ